jgi:hypothetical protein
MLYFLLMRLTLDLLMPVLEAILRTDDPDFNREMISRTFWRALHDELFKIYRKEQMWEKEWNLPTIDYQEQLVEN